MSNKEQKWEMWTGVASSGQEPACEYGKELMDSIKYFEFEVELINLQLFKTDFVLLVTLYHTVFENR